MTQSPDVTTIYNQICRRHDGIADFRAKMLALLPFASAGGLLVLIGDKGPPASAHLALGAFGAAIAFGLFLYELRGIQECNALIAAGRKLERVLLPALCQFGAFHIKPPPVMHLVGATGAALVIYPAVVAAWIYVAAHGALAIGWKMHPTRTGAIGGGAALMFGATVYLRQQKRLDSLIAKSDWMSGPYSVPFTAGEDT